MGPVPGRGAESRLLASLPRYLETLLVPTRASDAGFGGVIGEARSYAQNLHTLQLCVNELIPLLRSSGGGSGRCDGGSSPLPAAAFGRLESQAMALMRHLGRPLPPLGTPEALAGLAGAPCAIVDRMVIPLSPVAAARPPGFVVTVGGQCYVLRSEEARPVPELLRDLRRARERRAQQAVRMRPGLTRMASAFLRAVKPILGKCGPRNRGSYQLLYQDADHQLQHSRGHWVLVRGPVANRIRVGSVFVGLRLAGRKRQDWLGVQPGAGLKPGDFWTPSGDPLFRGICAGAPSQFRRLFSSAFSDAEAVVEWLDAGVILVTSRSDCHRLLRAGKEMPLRGRYAAILEGLERPGRPC